MSSQEQVGVTVTVTLKSGIECAHRLPPEAIDRLWTVSEQIRKGMKEGANSVLVIEGPYGMHRLETIDSIHYDYGDREPPAEMRGMGFLAARE